MELGITKCTFTSKSGTVCNCEFFGLDEDGACEECGHYQKYHGYSEPYEHHVLKSLGADILPRKTTVEKLVARMNTTKFLHLRGTPASGKTVLLKLIRAYLSCRKLKPVYVNWPSDFAASGWNGRGWKDFLLQETGFQDLDSLHSSDCVLLIDEGQLSYTQDGFWNETIKWVTGRRGPTIGLKIILAASFGSTGTPSDSFITPVHIGEDSVIELFPLDSSHPGIFLDPEEYLRLVENRERTCRIFLTDELKDKIWMFTMGHTGGAVDLIEYVGNSTEGKEATRKGERIAEGNLFEPSRLDDKVKSMPFKRGMPTGDQMQQLGGVRDALRLVMLNRFVWHDTITSGAMIQGLDEIRRRGWIHAQRDSKDRFFYCFPTGLHKWFVNYHFFNSKASLNPGTTLLSLTMIALRRFSRERIKNSHEVRRAVRGILAHNPEAIYQNELYRTLFESSNGVVMPVPEFFVGYGTQQKGRIDFVVGNQRWGIEALIDNDNVEEHYQRFVAGGKYVQASLSDYIVLNFRTGQPRKRYAVQNTYHCCFSDDKYTTMRVINAADLSVIQTFYLQK